MIHYLSAVIVVVVVGSLWVGLLCSGRHAFVVCGRPYSRLCNLLVIFVSREAINSSQESSTETGAAVTLLWRVCCLSVRLIVM